MPSGLYLKRPALPSPSPQIVMMDPAYLPQNEERPLPNTRTEPFKLFFNLPVTAGSNPDVWVSAAVQSASCVAPAGALPFPVQPVPVSPLPWLDCAGSCRWRVSACHSLSFDGQPRWSPHSICGILALRRTPCRCCSFPTGLKTLVRTCCFVPRHAHNGNSPAAAAAPGGGAAAAVAAAVCVASCVLSSTLFV